MGVLYTRYPKEKMSAVIILAFAIIGAGVKYIDDAFDKDKFSKKKGSKKRRC